MMFVALSAALSAAAPLPPLRLSFLSVAVAPDGEIVARVALLNPLDVAHREEDILTARLHVDGQEIPVELHRRGAAGMVPASGYDIVDYGMPRPDGLHGPAVLSIDGGPGGYAFAMADPGSATPPSAPLPERAASSRNSPSFALREAASGRTDAPSDVPRHALSDRKREPAERDTPFLANVFAYQPNYGAFGLGTNTDGKIQISFAYQLLGDARAPQGRWWEGFRFGYTQKMLWDTGANSQPFRDVNYHPELFYLWRGITRPNGVAFSAQAGVDHESNGRDGLASRAIQTVYVEPRVSLPIGGDYHIDVGPRLMHYVFGRDGNPDLPRYRGHQQLALAIGSPEGFKLSTTSRLNFGSGKGSVDALLSYPVTRLWQDLPVYLVVQGFTGYGEDMLDYNRKVSRIRVGIGLTR